MNKKGFLLGEETLKIIVALVCIGFLIYFLGALYYNSVKDKEVELAKATAERIVAEANAGATEIEVYNPEGWFVVNLNEGLICVCEKTDKCNFDKTCVESGLIVSREIRVENPPIILELNDGVLS
jgi:hypothetical protein